MAVHARKVVVILVCFSGAFVFVMPSPLPQSTDDLTADFTVTSSRARRKRQTRESDSARTLSAFGKIRVSCFDRVMPT